MIKSISLLEGADKMKRFKSLSLPLLLSFLAFTFIHFSSSLSHSHTDIKAIINIEDGKMQGQWDDEKKLSIDLHILLVFTIILSTAATPLIYLLINFERSYIFLIPIFHQSNYVILSPE
jgi:hypothetical protein